jgi:hypothetical protein
MTAGSLANNGLAISVSTALAQELIIGQLIQRLHLEMNILRQKASNHTHINVRLFHPASRNCRRSMILKVIIKSRNKVLKICSWGPLSQRGVPGVGGLAFWRS